MPRTVLGDPRFDLARPTSAPIDRVWSLRLGRRRLCVSHGRQRCSETRAWTSRPLQTCRCVPSTYRRRGAFAVCRRALRADEGAHPEMAPSWLLAYAQCADADWNVRDPDDVCGICQNYFDGVCGACKDPGDACPLGTHMHADRSGGRMHARVPLALYHEMALGKARTHVPSVQAALAYVPLSHTQWKSARRRRRRRRRAPLLHQVYHSNHIPIPTTPARRP